VGVGILMLWLILDTVKEYKLEKQNKTDIAHGETSDSNTSTDEKEEN
jgi:hypothetical protein